MTEKDEKEYVKTKDAKDAVEKYEIVANGITIYTQNFGCEESFLTACCANETTKRADVYSKAGHKDIWNGKSGSRTGFIVDWATGWEDKTYKIHLKIDLESSYHYQILNIFQYL